MIFINPWAYYQIHEPDKIPDLTPRDDEEAVGCLAGSCGFIIASAIFVWLMYFILDLKLNDIISTDVHCILMLITCIIIYPILIICLMKLSFKIGDKISKRKENESIHRHRTIKEVGRDFAT